MSFTHIPLERLHVLYGAAIERDLAPRQERLLESVNPTMVAGLPDLRDGTPAERLLATLSRLNAIRALADGSVPFEVWLRNALVLTGDARFEEVLAEITSRPTAIPLSELIVQQVSTWKSRHVFGNAEAPGVPSMALGDIYVEPDGTYHGPEEGTVANCTKPIRTLVRTLSKNNRIVIVRGDFGQGKSLTARTLACEWAVQYVKGKTARSGEQPWYPLFIKFAEDYPGREPSLDRLVARALQRQAREVGLELGEHDKTLAGPGVGTRVVYLIDGLDEVALNQREAEAFFRHLVANIGDNRAIIFSRKGAIPSLERLPGIPVVDLEHLRTEGERPGGQVAEWLARWNRLSGRPPISIEQIVQRELIEIARTPILLFMAVITWDDAQEGEGTVSRAEMYERFFLQIAAGKCRQDQDRQDPVADASHRLLERLVELGELEKPKPGVPESDARASAMLWMLGRIAWESRRCVERDEALSLLEMTTILKYEVGLRGEASDLDLEMIRMGVLLVLQADHHGGNDRILFGHESFREFLVARYWAHRLRQIMTLRHDHRRPFEAHLLGARLLEDDGRSLDFLMQIVNGPSWDDASRADLVGWAGECFNSQEPDFADPYRPSWLDDRRPVLREAALAIGSSTKGSDGITAGNRLTLRSMLAWFWARHQSMALLVARGLKSRGAALEHAYLLQAHLEGARLEGADLSFATLAAARLNGSQLSSGVLVNVRVTDSKFEGANLDGADLDRSVFKDTSFRGASLRKASFRGATLVGVRLDGADLAGASFAEAQLERANLEGAKLEGAQLQGAGLAGANLRRANLTGANLTGANLAGASFQDANLAGAKLEWASSPEYRGPHRCFQAARYDACTRWPPGFDAVAAGAVEASPASVESLPTPGSWPPPPPSSMKPERTNDASTRGGSRRP